MSAEPATVTAPPAGLAAQRSRRPEETLARLLPELPAYGVTRSASVTGLDILGVPTWVAIRPGGLILQVSNGKGLTDAAARVSALMEAVELHHAEFPRPERLVQARERDLREDGTGAAVVPPPDLPGFLDLPYGRDRASEWTRGARVTDGAPVRVPSSAVYFLRRPAWHDTSSNGLASGNTLGEASLHALYELVERDAMGRLRDGGRLKVRERGRVVRPESLDDAPLRAIVERCRAGGTNVVIVALPAAVPVHCFWVVLLGATAISAVSTVNVGWGCHAEPGVALARALTEAAQSRLGFIHGARDDLIRKPIHSATGVKASPAYRYLDALHPDTEWREIADRPVMDLPEDPEAATVRLAAAIEATGCGPVWRFDLSTPGSAVAVARLIAPGLSFRKTLF